MLQSIVVNRNTTLLGAAMIMMAPGSFLFAVFDGDANTSPDFNLVFAEVLAGIGLIMARDGNKTSEQSGARNQKRTVL